MSAKPAQPQQPGCTCAPPSHHLSVASDAPSQQPGGPDIVDMFAQPSFQQPSSDHNNVQTEPAASKQQLENMLEKPANSKAGPVEGTVFDAPFRRPAQPVSQAQKRLAVLMAKPSPSGNPGNSLKIMPASNQTPQLATNNNNQNNSSISNNKVVIQLYIIASNEQVVSKIFSSSSIHFFLKLNGLLIICKCFCGQGPVFRYPEYFVCENIADKPYSALCIVS